MQDELNYEGMDMSDACKGKRTPQNPEMAYIEKDNED